MMTLHHLALLGALVAPPSMQAPRPLAAARMGTALRMSGGEADLEFPQKAIPVTLLSGFLGAGKTTLLRHLLQNTEGVKIGVIVNDVAAINVDSKLVRDAETGVGQPEDMIELSNGCACCSAGDDLFGALAELVSTCFMRGQLYDHIIFEASGVAEPKLLRASFQDAQQAGWPLMRHVRLETMVTVVDASSFLELYSSTEKVSERADLGGDELGGDELPDVWSLPQEQAPTPSVVQLLVEQVETADVLVLNKVDSVDEAGVKYLTDALGAINGFAELLPTTFGQVAPSQLLVAEREAGVALSNEVMDHQSSVDFAKWLQGQAPPAAPAPSAAADGHAHSEHSHSEHSHGGSAAACDDPGCTDASHDHDHSHDHSHGHSHDHADGAACADPGCTDPTHDHSHSGDHNHDGAACADPGCTDPTHDHSHSDDRQQTTAATRFGITTFVYAARRPFVAERFNALLSALPFSRVVPPNAPPAIAWLDACESTDGEGGDGAAASVSGASGPFRDVMRSKGFVWLADDSALAYYWSQAGKQLELSQMGRWWAAVPRPTWPEEHVGSILADCEGEWGDRRQELIFIGANLPEAKITEALDACLASDAELAELAAARGPADLQQAAAIE